MASKIKKLIKEFLNKNITENIDIYDFLNEKREEIILKYGPETFRSLQNLLMIDKDGMGEIKVKKFMEDENFIEKEDIPFEENMENRKQQLKEAAEEKAMVYFLKKFQAGEIDKLPDNPLHAYIDLQMKGEVNEAEEEEEVVKVKGKNFKKHDITSLTEDGFITEKWDYEDEVMEGTCGYSEDGKPGKTPGGIKSMPADKRTKKLSKKN